ncbi:MULTISPECIES: amidase [Salipiger]|uniref:amidase n=1 Tax=Salipiger TaxID=263377 RepID=UPI003511CC12
MSTSFLTIAEASERIAAGTLTSEQLTRDCLDRIAALNETLHAFVLVREDEAMAAARAADAEISAGRRIGPLHGIPMGIKDIVETAGVRTTGQSALFLDRVPERSAHLWERLEAAGAILIGKTTTWEFAIGGTAHDLPFPPARNPWDPSRETGGSSSGSAAAVAAGLCSGAIGTDTGGSVRVPAAWCGIAGLKPTYGLVGRSGVYPLSHTLDHPGPMCWSSEDCALMMEVLAGDDPRDASTRAAPALSFIRRVKEGVAGLRIGVWDAMTDHIQTDPEVADAMSRGIDALREAGAEVRSVTLPPLKEIDAVCNLISRSESFAYHRVNLEEQPEKYGFESRARLLAGSIIGAAEYIEAQRVRTLIISAFEDAFEDFDLIVCEMTGSVAPPHGDATTYTRLGSRAGNVTGLPAHSVCTGFDAQGLPMAMQIIGPAFADAVLLAAGHVVEQACGARQTRALSRPRKELA